MLPFPRGSQSRQQMSNVIVTLGPGRDCSSLVPWLKQGRKPLPQALVSLRKHKNTLALMLPG